MDIYQGKYLNYIKNCKNNKEIIEIINKIYEDGFQDGNENR